MEKENKILDSSSNLIQAKISPEEFKKEMTKIIGEKNNINLYTIIEDFGLSGDSRTMIRISDLKNAIKNYMEDKWSIVELAEWAWNVNGLDVNKQDEDTQELIFESLFLLENMEINEMDERQISNLYKRIR
ncbi:hypothetical protein [Siminovitchia terrae]|uniref:hypothetical protein n=1 Tax=Siminovitchia terrae TaxID=1914933 RepID=UPI0028A897EF|nr:hypothetical protein [Siminovitchia terrae]